MKTNFYIKYQNKSDNNSSDIVLRDFGESLIAFDSLVKEFGQMFRIQTEIEVYATAKREGSYIVDLIFQVHDSFASLPIDNVDHLLEFLKIVGDQIHENAYNFFSDIRDLRKSVNDYGVKHPVDIAILALLIPLLFKAVKKLRRNKVFSDQELPVRIAKELYRIMSNNKFGQFLSPIVNDTAKSIELSTDKHFRKNTAKVDKNNVEEYLGEDAEVLPDLIDGNDYKLKGEITSLKSTRGDSLTFQYQYIGKSFNLDLLPPSETTTKAYTQYYKEEVEILATVERKSRYKKPKLHLAEIEIIQKQFEFDKVEQ